MSGKIARILDQPEHVVTKFLKELEEKNGLPSHDARYLAENVQKIRVKLSELGLDPDDTTGEELYHALLVKFQKSSRLFDLHSGGTGMSFDSKIAKSTSLITQNFELPSQWALKNQAAKDLLRELPPKKIMKYLGYRSLESMLKREKLSEIYLAAKYLESASWQKAHGRLISRLGQDSFELRPLSPIALNYEKWVDVSGPNNHIAANYDIGALSFWPSEEVKRLPLLSIVLLLTGELSAFGHIKPGPAIAKISGVVEWWADMDHLVAELAGEHTSLNIKDAATNSLLSNPYSQRSLDHGRDSFWRELLDRYEKLPPAEALFDNAVRERVSKLRLAAPELAYEFAEDFDG